MPVDKYKMGSAATADSMSNYNSMIFNVRDLGLIDYVSAYEIQKQCVEDVLKGKDQCLLLCEHPAVLTLGRLATLNNILCSSSEIEKRGVQIINIDRGGEVTLHSPGQLVIYPIFNLNDLGRDLKQYLYQLEQVAIDLLREFDIVAGRISGQRGVWVKEKKIVSMGIGVKKWIAYHGLAINVNTDLGLFSMIRPCGLDVHMTSMEEVLEREVPLSDVKAKVVECFEHILGTIK